MYNTKFLYRYRKFQRSYKVLCAAIYITSLYGDPLLNRKTVQSFAFSTNTFVLQLLDGLKQTVLEALPSLTGDEKYDLQEVFSNEKDLFQEFLTEHKRLTLLKKIGVLIQSLDI